MRSYSPPPPLSLSLLLLLLLLYFDRPIGGEAPPPTEVSPQKQQQKKKQTTHKRWGRRKIAEFRDGNDRQRERGRRRRKQQKSRKGRALFLRCFSSFRFLLSSSCSHRNISGEEEEKGPEAQTYPCIGTGKGNE